ncbi:MAG: leucine-rich repeat protein [Clostridia bacterium]|nr:leucine-rich repeat protein [Clostridia bacterium]
MKKKSILLAVVITLMLATVFAVSAVAATPATGYTKTDSGETTNIKWTMTEDGTLTFEIDPTATDKVASTVIANLDPITGTVSNYNTHLPTYAEAVKIFIGEGITSISGLSCLANLKQVELPSSVTFIGRACFETNGALESVYIKGTEPVAGTFDLSYVTKLEVYAFDGCTKADKVILSPNYAGNIPAESLKNLKFKELEIPEGVTLLTNKSLARSNYLEVITVLGMGTDFESDSVFDKNTTYPKIKAKAGSKAEAFAKANGYTFIDLDTGVETKGTKTVTDASKVGESSGGTALITDFNPEGATIFGHSSGGSVDIWWAYYDDTKTLELLSGTTAYNETGTIANVDPEYESWEKYKDIIEHLIIGDNIKKITKDSFVGYTALKDVRLGRNVNDINKRAFKDCYSLTTVWRDGTEPVEGRADLTNLKIFYENTFEDNKITEIILPKVTTEIVEIIDPTIQTLYVYNMTDSLIEYAKTNFFNVRSLSDPDEAYDYWVYYDPSLPSCGTRSVFSFDEATGTLTVHGGGAISSITNYYGGGSRNQPWLSIRKSVKHLIIGDEITSIGKYAFCEFINLETVQIPNSESFEILNAAFEKCYNLKSVYRSGEEPIEGTLDLRNVHSLESWTFAYTYLIANVIISPNVEDIGTTLFEENITLNLANIYGIPGSYAEEYAKENDLAFFDISSNTPWPIKCDPPETTVETDKDIETTAEPDITETVTAPESEAETVSTGSKVNFFEVGPDYVEENNGNSSGSNAFVIIIAIAAALVAAAIAVLVIIKKKKSVK